MKHPWHGSFTLGTALWGALLGCEVSQDLGVEPGVGGSFSADGTSSSGAAAGSGGQANGGAGVRESSMNVPPWTADSRHVELRCGSFFGGGMMFRADREQLSESELSALSNLRITSGTDACSLDGLGCSVVITDAANTNAYRVSSDDAACEEKQSLISYDSFTPLLGALECKFAKDESASLQPDLRCWHGMFASSSGTTTVLQLLPKSAGEVRHVQLSECSAPNRRGQITMQYFAAGDRTTPLGNGAPVADPGFEEVCLEMDLTFGEGALELVVETTSNFMPAGDYFMRYY